MVKGKGVHDWVDVLTAPDFGDILKTLPSFERRYSQVSLKQLKGS